MEATEFSTKDGKAPAAKCPSFPDDSELVARAKTCPRDFGELYDLHYCQILNYLYRQTLDVHVAEELTSNTFFKALRGLQAYRDQGSFRAWLYRIATNELRMYWRREKKFRILRRHSPLELVCSTQCDGSAIEDDEETLVGFAQLKSALDRLPERYRTAIDLRYFEKMPYAEVAEVLGKPTGTVRSLVHRGLGRLRRLMQDNHATLSRDLHLEREETDDETN
jgi:RNA polymerase sigma-70 factor (ECF subfamily)